MLIEYCQRLRPGVQGLSPAEAYAKLKDVLSRGGVPFGLSAPSVWPFLSSVLVQEISASEDGRHLSDGTTLPRVLSILRPGKGEAGRLRAKGQMLIDHCLAERSTVCVEGFFRHEIQKSLSFRAVLVELLGFLTERRFEVPAVGLDVLSAQDRVLVDEMLELGVTTFYGLSVEAARRLATAKREASESSSSS